MVWLDGLNDISSIMSHSWASGISDDSANSDSNGGLSQATIQPTKAVFELHKPRHPAFYDLSDSGGGFEFDIGGDSQRTWP